MGMALAIVVWGGPLDAQRIESPYRFVETRQSLGPFGGWFETDPGAANLGPQPGAYAGVRYSIRISGPFNFDAGFGVLPTTRMVMDTVDADSTLDVVGEADYTLGVADAALRFDITGPRTWHGITPYAIAGIALTFRLTSDDALEEEIDPDLRFSPGTTFAGQLGAGIEWLPVDRWSLRLDARDYLWKIEAPVGVQRLDDELPAEEWVQNYGLSLAVSYRF